MQMKAVKSSAITSVGYDEKTRTMHVLFRNGGLYKHENVSPGDHQKLLSAKSIGSHYTAKHQGTGKKVKR